MASLLDIAPADVTVRIRNVDVPVTGVSARGFVVLLTRYPALQELLNGKQLSPKELSDFGGDVIAAIIAAGTGLPGNLDAEAKAEKLAAGEQLDLLTAILRVTLPNGIGPFVEKLSEAGGALGLGAEEKAPSTTSVEPSKT